MKLVKLENMTKNYDVNDVHSIKKRMDINKINKPKIKLNLPLDREWANLTPRGAPIIVMGVIKIKPTKLTYP